MKQKPIILYTNVLLLISINLVMVTSLILQSSSPRVFAEQATYSCYGVSADPLANVCNYTSPNTLISPICTPENEPFSLTHYFMGGADILPISEKYRENITTGNNVSILPDSVPIGTKIQGSDTWSYKYNGTSPSISASTNNSLYFITFEVSTILSESQQGGGGKPPKTVKTSLVQPLRVEHKNTPVTITNSSAVASGTSVKVNADIADPENNHFDTIFEISKDNFATIANTFTISDRTNGNISHTFTGLSDGSYSYKIKANETPATVPALCAGFANSAAQTPLTASKLGAFTLSATTTNNPSTTPTAANTPPTSISKPTPTQTSVTSTTNSTPSLIRSGGAASIALVGLVLSLISALVYFSLKKAKLK